MSPPASTWVLQLDRAPNGAPITAAEMSVLHVLAMRHNPDFGCAWPKIERLARDCRLSERTVTRVLNALERKGVLGIEYGVLPKRSRQDRDHLGNVYRLVGLDPQPADAQPRRRLGGRPPAAAADDTVTTEPDDRVTTAQLSPVQGSVVTGAASSCHRRQALNHLEEPEEEMKEEPAREPAAACARAREDSLHESTDDARDDGPIWGAQSALDGALPGDRESAPAGAPVPPDLAPPAATPVALSATDHRAAQDLLNAFYGAAGLGTADLTEPLYRRERRIAADLAAAGATADEAAAFVAWCGARPPDSLRRYEQQRSRFLADRAHPASATAGPRVPSGLPASWYRDLDELGSFPVTVIGG